MPNSPLSKHSARIQDVWNELKDYKYFHSSYETDSENDQIAAKRFIGREHVKKRIVSILEKTGTKSGSYLVTGFRGMGKTSIVQEALGRFEGKSVKDSLEWKIFDRAANAGRLFFILIVLILLFGYINSELPLRVSDLLTAGLITLVVFPFLRTAVPSLAVRLMDNKTAVTAMFGILLVLTISVFHPSIRHGDMTPLQIASFSALTLLLVISYFMERFFVVVWNTFKLLFIGLIFLITLYTALSFSFPAKPPTEPLTLLTFNDLSLPAAPSISRLILAMFCTYVLVSAICLTVDLFALLENEIKLRVVRFQRPTTYQRFEINLSQDSLEEMDVLRRMTIAIEDYWKREKFNSGEAFFNRSIYRPWTFLLKRLNRPRTESIASSYNSVLEKLDQLRNRMSGVVTSKHESKFSPELKLEAPKITLPLGSISKNDEIAYPVANAKEAEDRLRDILHDINSLRKGKKFHIPEFVFVIDELDKIGPDEISTLPSSISDSSVYIQDTNRIRERREAVAKLLANMKGFMNVAKAKFFFIGGREMFDADLAGISDRDSF